MLYRIRTGKETGCGQLLVKSNLYRKTEQPAIFVETDDQEVYESVCDFASRYSVSMIYLETNDMELVERSSESTCPIVMPDVAADCSQRDNMIVRIRDCEEALSHSGSDCILDVDVGQSINPGTYLDNILWNIAFRTDRWRWFDRTLDKLREGYEGRCLKLMNYVLTVRMMYDHPCRVYLCNGAGCHSSHSNLPRMLTVADGKVYPAFMEDERFCIGELSDPRCLADYLISESHERFIDANREVFYSVADKIDYRYVPWSELVGELSCRRISI